MAAARESKPADYLKVIVMVLPRDIKVTLETMTDEELSTRIDRLTTSLGIRLVPRAPTSETIELDSHVLPNPNGCPLSGLEGAAMDLRTPGGRQG